ncbi:MULTISPECIES: glutathione S-transferase family protein [Pseudomonas]|uniref:Glutathione S-transferase n=1 Tax=Pseudomonas nitroreducens TaxID=46680 RepID=A0A246F7E1_PSENT|nr:MULTISPECIES: glutathione S-transferase family protein [Pseudomonas]MCG8910572.1 glutathione S-transferase family protein [Pseudomonas sp. DP-17]OWP48240.1 glutathione S-transferase [Pseudomonas nitroreducens]
MSLTLIIGSKNLSSWSLRGWLAMQLTGAEFEEILIPLGGLDTARRIREHSPSGKVPALKCEHGLIWDSLAIAEYLAERFPEAHLWPRGEAARALARSVCAEMHSGFMALRSHMPMDIQRNQPLAEVPEAVEADIARIVELWALCRGRFGQDGPFLFGHASIADAFYAPIATRLRSYCVTLPIEAQNYVDAIYAWPAFRPWLDAAMVERA